MQSIASAWATAQRQTFANDLAHPQLLAVTDNVNESKGDSGPKELEAPVVYVFLFSPLPFKRKK
jgi:hypothetical protein